MHPRLGQPSSVQSYHLLPLCKPSSPRDTDLIKTLLPLLDRFPRHKHRFPRSPTRDRRPMTPTLTPILTWPRLTNTGLDDPAQLTWSWFKLADLVCLGPSPLPQSSPSHSGSGSPDRHPSIQNLATNRDSASASGATQPPCLTQTPS